MTVMLLLTLAADVVDLYRDLRIHYLPGQLPQHLLLAEHKTHSINYDSHLRPKPRVSHALRHKKVCGGHTCERVLSR
jgi:hypothetical protein